jgi:hypothetical protein
MADYGSGNRRQMLAPCWICGKETTNIVLPSKKGLDYPDDDFVPMCRKCAGAARLAGYPTDIR